MAVTVNDLKQMVEMQSIKITQADAQKEGGIDAYIRQVAEEVLQESMGSSTFFPTRLDPKIYDNGVLYGIAPFLTFLEASGRKMTSDTTEIKHLKLTSGFTPEWITETTDTSGNGEATVTPATANMKFLALPISLSDLIGAGASGRAKSQLFEFALQAMREQLNATCVAGDGTGNTFKGIDKIAEDSGSRINQTGQAMTVEKLNAMETEARDVKKFQPGYVLTCNSVLDQIKADMMATVRNVGETDVTAGVTVPAYASNSGKIPIIADPNVPKTATSRRLDMANQNHTFLEEFMSTTYIQKGKSKPFATDGWLAQIIIEYDVAPGQKVQSYGIL